MPARFTHTHSVTANGDLDWSLETNDERNKEPEITVSPVTNLEAKSTQIANQLLITWQNPNTPNLLGVELSYLQKDGGTHNGKQIIQGTAGKTGNYT